MSNQILPKEENKLTCCSLSIIVKGGVAELEYPQSMRQVLNASYCIIDSVTSLNNFKEIYYIYCNVSFFRSRDSSFGYNLLQTFQSQENGPFFFPTRQFNYLNVTPNKIQFYLKKRSGDTFELDTSYEGIINLSLFGYEI